MPFLLKDAVLVGLHLNIDYTVNKDNVYIIETEWILMVYWWMILA